MGIRGNDRMPGERCRDAVDSFDFHHFVRGIGHWITGSSPVDATGEGPFPIAAMLNISVYTVETHRTHLMQKLNLHNIVEIVLYAIRKKIIS